MIKSSKKNIISLQIEQFFLFLIYLFKKIFKKSPIIKKKKKKIKAMQPFAHFPIRELIGCLRQMVMFPGSSGQPVALGSRWGWDKKGYLIRIVTKGP